MHMLIRGLVHAETPDEALETAKHDVFIPLADRGPFDYYVTFDADGRGIAGKDRWGDYPVVARVDSAEGSTLIEGGWDATVKEYEDSFDRVEELLDTYDRSAFWEDENIHREYHDAFRAISEYDGPHTYLYDEAGQGIRDRGHLERVTNTYADVLDETTECPSRDTELFVVPADVHY